MGTIAGGLHFGHGLHHRLQLIADSAGAQRILGRFGPGDALAHPVFHKSQRHVCIFRLRIDHKALIHLHVHLGGSVIVNGSHEEANLEIGIFGQHIADIPGSVIPHGGVSGGEHFQRHILRVAHVVGAGSHQTGLPVFQCFGEIGVIRELLFAAHQLFKHVLVAGFQRAGPDGVAGFDVAVDSISKAAHVGVDPGGDQLILQLVELGQGGGNFQTVLFEDGLIVEDAPSLKVDGEAVNFSVGGHVAQIAGGQIQALDDLVIAQIHNEALRHQIRIQTGVAHDDVRLVTAGQGGGQLGEVVGALIVVDVIKLHIGMKLGEGRLDSVQTGLLGRLRHVMEHGQGDLVLCCSKAAHGQRQH